MINLKNININEKAEYVTFTSPIKKNRKGHRHQINKSFKKINSEEREVIFKDLDMILENFEEISKDYLTFLKARNQYNEQAIKWVFEGTAFLKRDNEKKLLNLIETRIPIKVSNTKEIKSGEEEDEYYKFIYPTTILVGPSGSGKTTFLKQIIGAMNTSFPATSQANTTVGPLYVVNDVNSDTYMATVKFIGEESLLERVKSSYIESLKAFLSIENEEDMSSDEKIIDIIYKKFTIFDDKKVKLQNLLFKKDISNDLIKSFKKECFEFWELLEKIGNKQDVVIDKKFSNNTSDKFWEIFNDNIDEKLLNVESNSTINEFIEILNERIRKIIDEILGFLKETDIQWEFRILDYKKEYTIKNTTKLTAKNPTFELPKMITFKIKANTSDDEGRLQELFFKTMEFISSAHEEMQGKTLFPLVNQIRIKGCFKPLWEMKENLSNYILIDSEGIGHDLANTTISNELRRMMLAANNITLIQNGAEQMQKAFALTLKTLIHNAWISKTKFCFNRLEAFDTTAQGSVESKKSFIESNIKNVLREIVSEEADSKVKIVTDREYIYEDIILSGKENNSYYIEFLNKNINDRTGFITEDGKAIKEFYEKIGQKIPEEISNTIKKNFTEEFNPIDQLRNYLKDITTVIDSNEKCAKELGLVKLFPEYQLDILSGILNNANNTFVNDFIRLLNINTWQTIKAFNSRIAYDWDGREWRAFKPESMLTELLIKHVVSYLLNPNNIEEITKICGEDFVNYINHVVSSQITKKIMMLSTEKVYLELLESCWKIGAEFSGKDSTWYRKNLIQKKIREKFEVNNELYKFNQLYIEAKEIITEEPLLKEIKANYR